MGLGTPSPGNLHVPKTCPPTQNGRRAAGAFEVQLVFFGHCRGLALTLRRHEPALSPQKRGSITSRTGDRPLGESVCVAPTQALFRVLSKCPATPPGPLASSGGLVPSLTCLSLSVAIRGCLSWSCFLRSPFCGNTEERAQVGGQVRPGPHGPRHPAGHPKGQDGRSAPQVSLAASRTRGDRAVPRGAAYLWLPPHRGSSRGGAGAEATRRRAPAVQVCRPGCVCE